MQFLLEKAKERLEIIHALEKTEEPKQESIRDWGGWKTIYTRIAKTPNVQNQPIVAIFSVRQKEVVILIAGPLGNFIQHEPLTTVVIPYLFLR